MILVGSRGRHSACLERMLALDGSYRWERVGPGESASSAEIADFLARRAVKTRNNNKERGASFPAITPRMPRETGNHGGRKQKYLQVVRA